MGQNIRGFHVNQQCLGVYFRGHTESDLYAAAQRMVRFLLHFGVSDALFIMVHLGIQVESHSDESTGVVFPINIQSPALEKYSSLE